MTEAKAAATTTRDPPRPISYASARSLIHRALIYPPPVNLRTAEVYGGFPWSKNCMAISNRADTVLLARLRAGHTPLLKAYAYLLRRPTVPSLSRGATGNRTRAADMPLARCD